MAGESSSGGKYTKSRLLPSSRKSSARALKMPFTMSLENAGMTVSRWAMTERIEFTRAEGEVSSSSAASRADAANTG